MAAKKREAGAGKGRKTAPPNETGRQERARTNTAEARARRAEKNAGAKGESRVTEDYFARRSQIEHSEHPENPADSTVKHVLPQAGAGSEGQKGFPQGEYDVVEPAKAGKASKRSNQDALLDQHVAGTDVEALMKDVEQEARLSHKERSLVLETLQPGAEITHPAIHQWRVQQNNRFGHGRTLGEAIENFVLGDVAGPTYAISQYQKYSPEIKKQIEERDRAVAKRQGQSYESLPDVAERLAALEGVTPASDRPNEFADPKGQPKKSAAKRSGKKRK